MNEGKFSSGFLFGLIVGGGAVFLLGTKSGRNLLKILSERGMDGIADILEEYNFDDLEEEGEIREEEAQPSEESNHEPHEHQVSEKKPESPKKHFFKRIKK